jgi:Trk K+ transport system NAD-binding subunit
VRADTLLDPGDEVLILGHAHARRRIEDLFAEPDLPHGTPQTAR